MPVDDPKVLAAEIVEASTEVVETAGIETASIPAAAPIVESAGVVAAGIEIESGIVVPSESSAKTW